MVLTPALIERVRATEQALARIEVAGQYATAKMDNRLFVSKVQLERFLQAKREQLAKELDETP